MPQTKKRSMTRPSDNDSSTTMKQKTKRNVWKALLLCNIFAPELTAASMDDAYQVVQEMTAARRMQHQVSGDCWMNIVGNIYAHNTESTSNSIQIFQNQFSPGATFCSIIDQDITRKQAMALGLTQCHFFGSSREEVFSESCFTNGALTGTDQKDLQQCLANLDQTTFLIYSQFFTHSELMCLKLTEDLRMHTKNHVLERFEETTHAMDLKMKEVQDVLQKYQEASAAFDAIDAQIEGMKKIERQIYDKIDGVDGRIENIISKSIAGSIEQKASILISEIYGQSGIARLSILIAKMRQNGIFGWHSLILWSRFLAILALILLPSLFSKRFQRLRRIMVLLSLMEVFVEHLVHHFAKVGAINIEEKNMILSYIRSTDIPLYMLCHGLSFIISFSHNEGKMQSERREFQSVDFVEESVHPIAIQQMTKVLAEIQSNFEEKNLQIEKERNKLSIERDQYHQQIMNLHFQLQNQIQCSSPALQPIADANDTSSSVTLVTPSHITRGLRSEFHVAEVSIPNEANERRHCIDGQDRKRQRESDEGKDETEITKKQKNVNTEHGIYQ